MFVLVATRAECSQTRRTKFIRELVAGVAQTVAGTALSAQALEQQQVALSAQALRESQAYSAIRAQQAVSATTRALEDELVALQDLVRNIDRATVDERQAVAVKIASKQVELITAISRTSKLLRAAYNLAFPNKANQPIVIIPRDPADIDHMKAAAIRDEGLKEAAQGKSTACAIIAQAISDLQLERRTSRNNFEEQAASLHELVLPERLAFANQKLFFWTRRAQEAQRAIDADQTLLGLKHASAAAPPTATA